MEAIFITLNEENIGKEHICCAFSDKKCKDSYELKKESPPTLVLVWIADSIN